jgi:hypothetical protein
MGRRRKAAIVCAVAGGLTPTVEPAIPVHSSGRIEEIVVDDSSNIVRLHHFFLLLFLPLHFRFYHQKKKMFRLFSSFFPIEFDLVIENKNKKTKKVISFKFFLPPSAK